MVASVFEIGTGVLVGGTDVNATVGGTSAAVVGAAGVGVAGGVAHITASDVVNINTIIVAEFRRSVFIWTPVYHLPQTPESPPSHP